MTTRAAIYRLFLAVLPAVFFISSLANAMDQENFFPARNIQLSCSSVDNNSPLEKKKKSPAVRQTSFIYKIDQVQEKSFLSKESSLFLSFIFSYCLRAPPLV